MRTLTQAEYQFLDRIARMSSIDLAQFGLSKDSLVEPLLDGGMGSRCFYDKSGFNRRFGKILVQGEFNDEDGMLVSFTVNLDQLGMLLELDIWRVDFSPLIRLPDDNDAVVITSINGRNIEK